MLWIFLMAFSTEATRQPTIYQVNLANPPLTRWTHVQAEYASEIKAFAENYAEQVTKDELKGIVALLENGYLNREFAEELHGLANTVNITYDQAVFLNFMYEWNAYCTSIVVRLTNGTIIHGRNLDYMSSNFLMDTTVQIQVYKGTKYLYTSIGFAWYLGVGTGIGPGYSVSQNQRSQGGRDETFEALAKGYQGDLWILRQSFINFQRYDEAIWYLSNSKLAASTYYIVAGLEQGAILVRNRDDVAGSMLLNDQNWYLVQTNSDPWLKDPDGRRLTAMKNLDSIGQKNMNVDKLLEVLQTFPVINPTTVFTTIMVPESGYLNTTIYTSN